MAVNPQFAQTPRGRAVAAQPATPTVKNGIAMIGGVPYVMTNTAAIGIDNRGEDMNRYAQEFQSRAGANLSGQARSTALGVPSLGAPRTGQWVPVSSLTPEFYTRNYEQNWKNAPGYTPVLTPALKAALDSGDPNRIAAAHYDALHTLPDKGQDFGSFLADFAPQIALGAIPGVGPALAAGYGGIRTAVNGGSPLEILLNTAGGWGAGNLIPGIQAAGGIPNFIGQGISKATGIFSNPSSAFSGATSGAVSNPFKTAVDIAGNIPTSLVKSKQTTPATPTATPAPPPPAAMNPASPSFVGPRPITRPAPATTPVRRADGGPISSGNARRNLPPATAPFGAGVVPSSDGVYTYRSPTLSHSPLPAATPYQGLIQGFMEGRVIPHSNGLFTFRAPTPPRSPTRVAPPAAAPFGAGVVPSSDGVYTYRPATSEAPSSAPVPPWQKINQMGQVINTRAPTQDEMNFANTARLPYYGFAMGSSGGLSDNWLRANSQNTPPVRRADGGAISDPMHPMGDTSRAMNPMGVTSEPKYGLEGLRAMAQGGNTTAGGIVEGYLDGPGDGMSDSIKATIDGKQPARLADGEFVIPADVVSGLGNGSSKAGAKVLYAMMDRVRQARTGTTKQGKEIDPEKFLPA